jgi:hypothetical protein
MNWMKRILPVVVTGIAGRPECSNQTRAERRTKVRLELTTVVHSIARSRQPCPLPSCPLDPLELSLYSPAIFRRDAPLISSRPPSSVMSRAGIPFPSCAQDGKPSRRLGGDNREAHPIEDVRES